jgi:hypothetical protein
MHMQSEVCNFAITSTETDERELQHHNIANGLKISEMEKYISWGSEPHARHIEEDLNENMAKQRNASFRRRQKEKLRNKT